MIFLTGRELIWSKAHDVKTINVTATFFWKQPAFSKIICFMEISPYNYYLNQTQNES